MHVLIFHARAWSYNSAKDGHLVEGNALSYLEDMPPAVEPNEAGLCPMTLSASKEVAGDVIKAKLPAMFDVDMGRRAGRDGKPETFLTRAKFIRSVPVEALLGPSK